MLARHCVRTGQASAPGASDSGPPTESGSVERDCPGGNVASAPERPAAVGQLRAERQCGIVWVERRERFGASGRGRPSENGAAARHCLGGNVPAPPERPAAVGHRRAEQQRGIVWAGTSRAFRSVQPWLASGEQNSCTALSVRERASARSVRQRSAIGERISSAGLSGRERRERRSVQPWSASGEQNSSAALSGRERRERPRASGSGRPA
ncbi:hypothetical protein AV654_19330 [Paenibacillus elgii]|uniref:Uncharacterized protein n=1 Tax=Paenibacillus elgii TaxID=189691 RepID=A0A161S1R5_9BACL|nr:hypothetical protein [Paenibacillus elgii]KZE78129.1 hypothetical protein AV654_19330 [Paenibacillus elgii]